MALEIASGTFNSPVGTGNVEYNVTSFTPKLVMFYSVQFATDAAAGLNMMIGAATASTEQWAVSMDSMDNQAFSVLVTGRDDTKCIVVPTSNSTTPQVAASLVSLDADGFTLNWTNAFFLGREIHWLALGGDDIADAHAGVFDTGTTTGNLGITGPGFTPDVVLFAIGRIATFANDGLSATASSAGIAFGAATSSTERWTSSIVAEDNVDTSNVFDFFYSSRCCSRMLGDGSFNTSLDFVSMDASGFTVDRVTAANDCAVQYVAIDLATTAAAVVSSCRPPNSCSTTAARARGGSSAEPTPCVIRSGRTT